MNIKPIAPDLWLLDVRVYDRGKEYRRREKFQGGKAAAEARFYELRRDLTERAEKLPRSLKAPRKLSTFSEVLDY